MRTLVSAASLSLLLGLGVLGAPPPATAQSFIGISVNFAPPALPYYEQPPIPGYGYIWTPGYWAWDEEVEDYYWVPGVWVLPPRIGYLWTPGWWGWNEGRYLFNAGYWGPHIGYYGGVNYGFGYNGSGYFGGEWRGRNFYYNRTVNNVRNVNITNIYERNVQNNTFNRVSYSGGRGGVQGRPTPEQMAAQRDQHIGFTPVQQDHLRSAQSQPAQRAAFNHGAPPIAATVRPGAFSGPGVVAARGASQGGAPQGGYRPGNEAYRGGMPHGGETQTGPRPGNAEAYHGGPAGGPYNGYQRPVQGGPQGYDRPQPRAYPPASGGPAPYAQDRRAYERQPGNSTPRPYPPASEARPQAHFAQPGPQPQAFHAGPPPAPRPAPQPKAEPRPEHRDDHPHEDRRG